MGWVSKALRVGRIVEPAPPAPQPVTKPPAGVRGSLQIRHVDAGSCNGCEVEIAGAFGPVYDAERFGARLVASPRHADALLVTGVVTHNMAGPLRATIEATPATAAGDRLWGLCHQPGGLPGRLWRGRRRRRGGARRRGNPGVPADTEPDRRGPAVGDRQVTAGLATGAVAAPNLIRRADRTSICAGVLTSVLGGAGVWAGALGMFGQVHAVRIGWLLPLSGVQLGLDPLGGFFMALTGAVAVAVGLYAIGYARREQLGQVTLAVLPVFVAANAAGARGGVGDHFPAGMGIDGGRVVGVGAGRPHPPAGSLRRVGLRGDDPVGFRGDTGRADGVVGGWWRGPVCRLAPNTAGRAHRGVSVDACGVRFEGRAGTAARLVAARPPGGARARCRR